MNEPSLTRPALAALVPVGLIAAAWGSRRFTRVEVEGDSMRPALSGGDRLLVYRTERVRPGDVVVVRDPRDERSLWVKRVRDVTDGGIDVRGDDPGRSTDSRHVGPIPRRLVVGRVVRRYAEG